MDVVPGFSLTNRMLLYTSFLLAPAQFTSGLGNYCPSNFGFLAYNWYTQIHLLRATQGKELRALSLVIPHICVTFNFGYLGGISSGSTVIGTLQGILTAGLMLVNAAVMWISWRVNQPDGFGTYEFFFFGWRTLTPDWHTFFLVWGIFDTFAAVGLAVGAIFGGYQIASNYEDNGQSAWKKWLGTIKTIFVGAASAMLALWPLVLWIELIVGRNHVESETDWIAVWLFVAQVVTMTAPPLCSKWSQDNSETDLARLHASLDSSLSFGGTR